MQRGLYRILYEIIIFRCINLLTVQPSCSIKYANIVRISYIFKLPCCSMYVLRVYGRAADAAMHRFYGRDILFRSVEFYYVPYTIFCC